jgi:hypothetical protein
MSAWRRVAIEMMPSMQRHVAMATNPCDLWITLCMELNRLYESDLADDAIVAGIYCYGRWCLTDARNGDLATAACVCFYEHIPTDSGIRQDAARWLSIEEFDGLKEIFAYHLGPDELTLFTQEFLERKKALVRSTHS